MRPPLTENEEKPFARSTLFRHSLSRARSQRVQQQSIRKREKKRLIVVGFPLIKRPPPSISLSLSLFPMTTQMPETPDTPEGQKLLGRPLTTIDFDQSRRLFTHRSTEKTMTTSPPPATPESTLFRFGKGGQRSTTPLAPPPTREEDEMLERVFCAQNHHRFSSSSSSRKSENGDRDQRTMMMMMMSQTTARKTLSSSAPPLRAEMDDDENDRHLLRKAQKRLEMQRRSRLTLVQRRLAEADAGAESNEASSGGDGCRRSN